MHYVLHTINWQILHLFQSGFDVLHSLIPSLNQTPSGKVSKAAMLQKGQLLLSCMLALSVLGSDRKSKMYELIYCQQLVWFIRIIFIYFLFIDAVL